MSKAILVVNAGSSSIRFAVFIASDGADAPAPARCPGHLHAEPAPAALRSLNAWVISVQKKRGQGLFRRPQRGDAGGGK